MARSKGGIKPATVGLGTIQQAILAAVAKHGGEATSVQVEAAIRTKNPPAMYRALTSLERRGLIARERQPRPLPTIIRLRGESDGA
jgi:uncharacterized membrane protein